MKVLESAPERYDKGIRMLTFGRLEKVYDDMISYIKRGQKVLDIGCGTGALTIKAAQKGAKVKGIDINPAMLEIAQRRVKELGLTESVELCEMGVAELENEESESYDVVMSGLCFSELSEDELKYTLKHIRRILKPGGLLLVADEVKPKNFLKKIVNQVIRIPLKAITYLLTQTTTYAIEDLPTKVKEAGFNINKVKLNKMENFIELIASKPYDEAK